MITSLVIENFKAITHLKLSFPTPFTVLIGGNSCGKSTILQALDFARAFATRDIDEYLHERGWVFEDIQSQFTDECICIGIGLTFNIDNSPVNLSWVFTVADQSGRLVTTEMIERIESLSKREILLTRGRGDAALPEEVERLLLKSSFLKLIDENNPSADIPVELYAIKKFFSQSSSYELLSPDRMRDKGSRGDVRDIGVGGEKLAAYINTMTRMQKDRLNYHLSSLVGYEISMSTEVKRPGWVDLYFDEHFPSNETKIKTAHISDGLLRLVAIITATIPDANSGQYTLISALSGIPDSGFILLDEIEDGINPYLTEQVIDLLRRTISESGKQIIITTHSPVMLNHFTQEEVIFMWRDENGLTHAGPMLTSDGMSDILEYFNPGEVWLNYSKEEILKLMKVPHEGEQV